MKASVYLAIAASAAACAGSEPTPSTPHNDSNASGATSRQGADDPSRALTRAECESLGELILETCTGGNGRSAQADGWCSDTSRRVREGSWVTDDCVEHVKVIDAVCFQSAGNARGLMDCDRTIERK
jgi:hypothetical protein